MNAEYSGRIVELALLVSLSGFGALFVILSTFLSFRVVVSGGIFNNFLKFALYASVILYVVIGIPAGTYVWFIRPKGMSSPFPFLKDNDYSFLLGVGIGIFASFYGLLLILVLLRRQQLSNERWGTASYKRSRS